MEDQKKRLNWRFIGHSTTGARKKEIDMVSHNKMRCSIPENKESLSFVLSCAEGNKSNQSFRGNKGAAFAVEASSDLYDELLKSKPDGVTDSKKWIEKIIKNNLVKSWRVNVADDIYYKPFKVEDFKNIEQIEARHQAVLNPVTVYDAQLLTVIGLESTLVFFRIGEGEVIIGFEDKSMGFPIPKEKKNEIFVDKSLSLKNSKDFIEIAFHEFSEIPPPFIFVFSRSLDEHLPEKMKTEFIRSILHYIIQGDLNGANKKLEKDLKKISNDCREDVSFGAIYRADIFSKESLFFRKTIDKEKGIDAEEEDSKDDYF